MQKIRIKKKIRLNSLKKTNKKRKKFLKFKSKRKKNFKPTLNFILMPKKETIKVEVGLLPPLILDPLITNVLFPKSQCMFGRDILREYRL
jgi:hypothetical protein